MAIQFNAIPGNIRVPFVRFEVNAGQAPYQSIQKLVLFGQKTSSGTALVDTPVLVTGGEDGLFGVGSMLSGMYKIARANAPFQEIWAIPLADAGGATKASATLDLSGYAPVASPGTVVLYVGGVRVTVPVTTLMNANAINAAVAAAINSCGGMQVTAAAAVGTVATGLITVNTAPGAIAELDFYVNSVRFAVATTVADTAATIAAKIAAAINASTSCKAYATSSLGVVTVKSFAVGVLANAFTLTGNTGSDSTAFATAASITAFAGGTDAIITLTANNGGTLGNTIRVETKINPDDGDLSTALYTIAQFANGAGDPAITNGLANMGDGLWDWIVMPWCQSAYLNEIEAWLDARWGPMSQAYGHNITAFSGTAGQTLAFTLTRNSWHSSIMPSHLAPQPTYLWAAALGAVTAVHMQSPPELSRPMQTLPLIGILPPVLVGNQWSTVQRQSFYYGGASGFDVLLGQVRVDRLITTYRLNAWGQPDQTFLDINTIAQIVYGVRSLLAYMTQTYPRAALVDSNPNNIQGFVTANDIRAAFVHAYKGLVAIGVFENAEVFAALLICERNATDPNRVDTYLPLDAVNQLRVLAVNATTYLQFPTA
jgi:phage tail sheath gpL-like